MARKRGGNRARLDKAAARAATHLGPRRSWWTTPEPIYPARTAKLPMPDILAPKPRQPVQRRLFAKQRASTLGVTGKPLTRRERAAKGTFDAWKRDICADYQSSKRTRRETLFATGSAGTGRRKNKGTRRRADWRAELCR